MPWVICAILKFIELLLKMTSLPLFTAAASRSVLFYFVLFYFVLGNLCDTEIHKVAAQNDITSTLYCRCF